MAFTYQPFTTVTPPSSFLPSTQGFTQGDDLSDPTSRMHMATGIVANTVTGMVYGGMAITESVAPPTNGLGVGIGNDITVPTTVAEITGFLIANRANNMLITSGNVVQSASAGMTVAFYRLHGSAGARIAVSCTDALMTAVESNPITTQVTWNFATNQLDALGSGTAIPNIQVLRVDDNSKVVSVSGTPVVLSWTTGPVAVIQLG